MKAVTNTNRETIISDPFSQAEFNANGLGDIVFNQVAPLLPPVAVIRGLDGITRDQATGLPI